MLVCSNLYGKGERVQFLALCHIICSYYVLKPSTYPRPQQMNTTCYKMKKAGVFNSRRNPFQENLPYLLHTSSDLLELHLI